MRLNEIRQIDFLYHAAPTSLRDQIGQEGLTAAKSQSSQNAIYLSDDKFTAMNYACMRPEEEHLLLRIRFSDLAANQLGPDDYECRDLLTDLDEDDPLFGREWDDLTWQESLQVCNQIVYFGRIAPHSIEILGTFRC